MDWSEVAYRPAAISGQAVGCGCGKECSCRPGQLDGLSSAPLDWEPDSASVIEAILGAGSGRSGQRELPAEVLRSVRRAPNGRAALNSAFGAKGVDSDGTGSYYPGEVPEDKQQDPPAAPVADDTPAGPAFRVRCSMSPRSAFGSKISSLVDVCAINLGRCSSLYPSEIDPLSYTFDEGLLPILVRRQDVFQHYLPDWAAKRTIGLTDVDGMINMIGTPFEGLFWNEDGGFLRGAIRFALVTLHTYAEFLTAPEVLSIPCKTTTTTALRQAIENAGWTETYRADFTRWTVTPVGTWPACGGAECVVNIDSGGLVTVSLPNQVQLSPAMGNVSGSFPSAVTPGFGGVVYLGDTSICPQMWTTAALADYFFWWSSRLYAEYLLTGDEKADRVGRACALAAMSELATITGLLAHEWTHVCGSWYEDEDDWCQNACHHLLGDLVTHRLLAEFGTPAPLTINGWPAFPVAVGVVTTLGWAPTANRSGTASALSERDRFDLNRSDTWTVTQNPYSAGEDDSFTGAILTYTHGEPWVAAHPLTMSWQVPLARCWTEIDGLSRFAEVTFNQQGSGRNR